MFKKISICVALLLSINSMVNAQAKKHSFKVDLNEEGSTYIKFGGNLQLWGRYTALNPGSKVGSNEVDHTYDFVIRRLRMQALGMLTEKVFFHIQLGQNNINLTQNVNPYNAPLSVFDALGEYHFSEKLHVGAGICGWGAGTTRYSAQSSSSQLTVDAPIYQQNNITSTYGNRNLSIYAKGQVSNFSYRVALTNPYVQSKNSIGAASSVSTKSAKPNVLGMITYNFLEKESIAEPFNKGTYLGTKKVFNIGVGFMTQSRAMWRLSDVTPKDTIYENMNVFGADLFYDAPLSEKGSSITAYLAYNHCDYGKNYLRNIATPNPATNGSGSGFLGIGTGEILYAQVGYLFNKSANEEKKGRAQLYLASEIAALQALKTPMAMYEAGVNYYITGSFGPKVTLGYQSRNIFGTEAGETKQVVKDRKGMLVLQYQVSF